MKKVEYLELDEKDVMKMPFDALYEYYRSSFFNTGTQKRNRGEFFTPEELEELPKYVNKAKHQYYNRSYSMRMPEEEYLMWDKIGKFLYKYWCNHLNLKIMYDNYNYPPGSDTPEAPWNQKDSECVDVDVCASVTLSRSATIPVDDYDATEWEDWDTGDEGETIHTGGTDYDFSNCNLKSAFEENEFTVIDLLGILKEYVEEELKGLPEESKGRRNYLSGIVEACNAWKEDEFEVVEE